MKTLLILAGILTLAAQLLAQSGSSIAPLPSAPAHHELDFWLGDWEAVVDGKVDGTDLIARTLGGAAIVENWHDADGHEGKSWFYFYAPENRWKQVWVTDVGFVKEKVLIAQLPGGAVRFRGEIPRRDGSKLLDQTTLTPMPDGTVHQVIEQSADGGKTWKTGYDAVYRRRQSVSAPPSSP